MHRGTMLFHARGLARQSVGLIIYNPTHAGGDLENPGPNEFVNPSQQGNEYWAISAIDALYTTARQKCGARKALARLHAYSSKTVRPR